VAFTCCLMALTPVVVGQNAADSEAVFLQVLEVSHASITEFGSQLHDKKGSSSISPRLDPVSDSKFFKKDYPEDLRPGVTKRFAFGHPYPAVQDGEEFDHDFVKDENTDGGQWKAQISYDKLRARFQKENADVIAAEKQEAKERKELAADKETEDKAEQNLVDAKVKADRAKKDFDDADNEVSRLERDLSDAIRKVEQEMKDLEKCKEQLTRARDELKELMAQKKKKEQSSAVVKAIVAKEIKEVREKTMLTVHGRQIKSKADIDALQHEIVEKQKVTKQDEDALASQLTKVKESEEALNRAAEKLRNVRNGEDKNRADSNTKDGITGSVQFLRDRSTATRTQLVQLSLAVILSSLVAISASI